MTTLQLSEIRVRTLGALWILLSLLFISGCGHDPIAESQAMDCLEAAPDSSAMPAHAGIRGALLTSRFSSLEELKSVVRIEYFPNASEEGQAYRGDSLVRLTHCSNGQTVVSILAQGVDEGDFTEAYKNGFLSKISLGLQIPFAVKNRHQLQKVYFLSRWRQGFFGEGDPAFYDLAVAMVDHISTPETAFIVEGDQSEKGYLNTFNHITAQAFFTSLYSEALADFIADVHERYTLPELSTGRFSQEQLADFDKSPVDNYIDIVNNEWGQELGKRLKKKYNISESSYWTTELMVNYLNDIQSYFCWAFQCGMQPFREDDQIVVRFTNRLNFVRNSTPNFPK